MSKKSLTIDDSTRASHQGQIRINKIRWLKAHPKWPLVFTALMLISSMAGLQIHWGFWILGAAFLSIHFFYWTRIEEHFLMGDANPGIIVSTSPLLLAVRTDLRKGPNLCFPVLKIVPSSKARCWGPAPQEGQRVVTVALYSEHLGEQRPPYWLDFDPISPEPYVDSFLETNGLLNSFGDDEWDALEQGILEMNSKWIPGLHRLEQESTDWKTHPPLGSGV